MKAIGFKQPFKLEEGNVFEPFELDMPRHLLESCLLKYKV